MEQAYSDLLFDQKQEIEDKDQEEEAFARSIPAYSILVKIMTSFVQLNSLASGTNKNCFVCGFDFALCFCCCIRHEDLTIYSRSVSVLCVLASSVVC
jgi:hypothetical protein